MRVKDIVGCLFLSIMLVIGGVFGVKYTYNLFFNPASIIENVPEAETNWKIEKEEFEKKVLYPYISYKNQAKEPNSDWNKNKLRLSSYIFTNTEQAIEVLYSLAGYPDFAEQVKAETAYFFVPSETAFYDFGLEQMLFFEENYGGQLVAVISSKGCPLLLQHRSSINDDALQIEHHILDDAELPNALYQYLSLVDSALGVVPEYMELIYNLRNEDLLYSPQSEELEIVERPEGSLNFFADLGEWHIYSDGHTSAYVCILGQYSFSVYYDVSANTFCGYNLVQGSP